MQDYSQPFGGHFLLDYTVHRPTCKCENNADNDYYQPHIESVPSEVLFMRQNYAINCNGREESYSKKFHPLDILGKAPCYSFLYIRYIVGEDTAVLSGDASAIDIFSVLKPDRLLVESLICCIDCPKYCLVDEVISCMQPLKLVILRLNQYHYRT